MLTAEEAERRATKEAQLARERRNEEWRRLSEQVRVAMQAGDWKFLQSAYQQQANILFVEGRPHLHVAQEARRAQLMSFLETSIADVKVRTSRRRTGMRILSVARPQGIHYPRKPWRRCPYPVQYAPMATNKPRMVAAAAAIIARSFLG